jgi:hypothetical protein
MPIICRVSRKILVHPIRREHLLQINSIHIEFEKNVHLYQQSRYFLSQCLDADDEAGFFYALIGYLQYFLLDKKSTSSTNLRLIDEVI